MSARPIDHFAYVRDAYGMPWLKRGVAVLAIGKPGKVTHATHYVFVRLDGEKHPKPYHPSDVTEASPEEASHG